MLREREPSGQGRHSRLEGWKSEPKILWYKYFPKRGKESPSFAHIIALECVKNGYAIPKDVSDVMDFLAKRDKKGIEIAISHWNSLVVTGVGPYSKRVRVVDEFVKSIAYTFGEFDQSKWQIRRKLIKDAMTFEASIFSSGSVN